MKVFLALTALVSILSLDAIAFQNPLATEIDKAHKAGQTFCLAKEPVSQELIYNIALITSTQNSISVLWGTAKKERDGSTTIGWNDVSVPFERNVCDAAKDRTPDDECYGENPLGVPVIQMNKKRMIYGNVDIDGTIAQEFEVK